MRLGTLNNLTFARFVAALLVVFHHAGDVLQNPAVIPQPWLRTFFNSGYIGVTFFFVLSGFVIGASSFDKLSTPSFLITLTFLARRVIRIVPLWLLLSIPFVVPAFSQRPIPSSLWSYLTFTQAWSADQQIAFSYLGVAWTLSCEMFFYAMFPLTAFVMARLQHRFRYAAEGLIVAALLVPLCAYLLFALTPSLAALDLLAPNGAHRWLYRNPGVRFSEFLLGLGMFLCLRKRQERLRQSGQRSRWVAALVTAILVLGTCMSWLPESRLTLTLVYVFPFALIVFSLAAIEINERPLSIRMPLLLLLGEASYALYLVHVQYGLKAFGTLFGPEVSLSHLAFRIVLTIALSVGLYQLVEMPTRVALNACLEKAKLQWRSKRMGAPLRQPLG